MLSLGVRLIAQLSATQCCHGAIQMEQQKKYPKARRQTIVSIIISINYSHCGSDLDQKPPSSETTRGSVLRQQSMKTSCQTPHIPRNTWSPLAQGHFGVKCAGSAQEAALACTQGGWVGRLPTVLMQHPPPLSVKSGGGLFWGVRPRGGGVPKVGGPVRDPLLPHAYLQGGCVSRGLGLRRYVCDNSAFSSLLGRKS